ITIGVSVAERARLFGTQVKSASSKNQQTQRSVPNQQSKSNIVYQDRHDQQPNTNVDRRPKTEISYSTPQKVSNNRRSPARVNRTTHAQPSSTNSHTYSTLTRPTTRQIPHSHDHNRYSPTRHQTSSYDSFQHAIPLQQQAFGKENHAEIVLGKLYTPDNDLFLELYDRQRSPSHNTAYRISDYFQSTQDPLKVLLKNSSERYPQQQIPITTDTDLTGMQPFDLGNIMNRIQQDYLDNVRPYVSSVKFVDNDQSLADIGFITPATTRRGYTRQMDDIYHRQIPSHHHNYIDTNGFRSYDKMHRKQSINRRKHKARYRDQASSPIPSSDKMDTRRQLDTDPVTKKSSCSDLPADPIPKLPTPTATSYSEEEEESTRASGQPEMSKTTQQVSSDVTSSESSTASEDDSQEHLSTTPIQPPLSKPVDEDIRASVTAKTQTSQRSELIRPALQNQIPSTIVPAQIRKGPAEESETEESESETESDSDSDSDDEDENLDASLAAARPANTPQINARAIPQRTNTDNNLIQPFDPEDSGKSSSFTGKLKSLVNKFRRKKSLTLN
ncbi:unnamed protein product, partial [Didymodactylos carnosus]